MFVQRWSRLARPSRRQVVGLERLSSSPARPPALERAPKLFPLSPPSLPSSPNQGVSQRLEIGGPPQVNAAGYSVAEGLPIQPGLGVLYLVPQAPSATNST